MAVAKAEEARPTVISQVLVEHLEIVWPRIAHYIERALASDNSGRYFPPDVYQILREGKVKLWVAVIDEQIRAVITTELIQYPRCRECRIWFLAGEDMEKWRQPAMVTLEKYARDNACMAISTCGRDGWLRAVGGEKVGLEMKKSLWGAA